MHASTVGDAAPVQCPLAAAAAAVAGSQQTLPAATQTAPITVTTSVNLPHSVDIAATPRAQTSMQQNNNTLAPPQRCALCGYKESTSSCPVTRTSSPQPITTTYNRPLLLQTGSNPISRATSAAAVPTSSSSSSSASPSVSSSSSYRCSRCGLSSTCVQPNNSSDYHNPLNTDCPPDCRLEVAPVPASGDSQLNFNHQSSREDMLDAARAYKFTLLAKMRSCPLPDELAAMVVSYLVWYRTPSDFQVGDLVDARDVRGVWHIGEILDVDQTTRKILVHFV